MGYIYKITNTVNNKIYIGKTEETIKRRFYKHKLNVKTGKKHSRLYSAMKHYGVDKFIVEELDHAESSEELCEKEKYWIKKLNSQDPEVGYNIAPGGEGGFTWSAKGYVTMNKDNKNTFVHPEKIGEYLENGWSLGSTQYTGDSIRSYLLVNNEEKQICVTSEELSDYLKNGWKFLDYKDNSRQYGRQHGLFVHNGEIQMRVLPDELQAYLDNGWKRGGKKLGPSSDTSRKSGLWINDGERQMRVLPDELQTYLDNGWKRGGKKLRPHTDDSSRRAWINNGEKNICVLPDELQAYLDDGWVRGYCKKAEDSSYKKLGSSSEGTKLIHKGEEQIRIMPDELQTYLDNGWTLGGKKLGPCAENSRRRGLWVNDGERQMRVLPDELQNYLDNGWVRGYCKKARENLSQAHQGQVPWNKGGSMSAETRDKLSKAVSGFRWMNDGTNTVQVKEKDIQSYIDKGYKFGVVKKKKEGDICE